MLRSNCLKELQVMITSVEWVGWERWRKGVCWMMVMWEEEWMMMRKS